MHPRPGIANKGQQEQLRAERGERKEKIGGKTDMKEKRAFKERDRREIRDIER